jgi:hypothetical protein
VGLGIPNEPQWRIDIDASTITKNVDAKKMRVFKRRFGYNPEHNHCPWKNLWYRAVRCCTRHATYFDTRTVLD